MYNHLWDAAYEYTEAKRAEVMLATAHRLLVKEGGEPEIVLAAAILATVPKEKRHELLKAHVDHELHAEINGILEADPGNKNTAIVHDVLLLTQYNKLTWNGDIAQLRELLPSFRTASGKTEAKHYLAEREHDAGGLLRPGAQPIGQTIKTATESATSMKPAKREAYHWADQTALRIIAEKGEKTHYTVAAGITPSGDIHIGNFREIITNDLIVKALERLGKKVRFIYSWDDYDVFRKVPTTAPEQELLKTFLRQPIVDVPDTFDHAHESYAEHNKALTPEDLPIVGIFPEFLHQHKKYRACEYAEDMRHALLHREEIRQILNQFKTEEITSDNWWPLSIYCQKCNRDTTTVLAYDDKYAITYSCKCGYQNTFDMRKHGIAKLPWRVDWPMRWHKEQVDFEPGGKDHSSQGGSYDTGKIISKQIWNFEAPTYIMYDFINIKGVKGKMSSSKGNTVNLREVLKVYTPEVTRFLFAGTRPNAEFSISFDTDVFKIYEDFDKIERMYFGAEDVTNEKELENAKRIYELSMLARSDHLPLQPSFRHLTTYVQIAEGDMNRVVNILAHEIRSPVDEARVRSRAQAAWNWIQEFAPPEYCFKLQDTPYDVQLPDEARAALKDLGALLAGQNEEELFELFYQLCQKHGLQNTVFFKYAYSVLVGKERGPKLANFITQAGHERIASVLKQL
jgi:lysyl-tRNA synthetase, class I